MVRVGGYWWGLVWRKEVEDEQKGRVGYPAQRGDEGQWIFAGGVDKLSRWGVLHCCCIRVSGVRWT